MPRRKDNIGSGRRFFGFRYGNIFLQRNIYRRNTAQERHEVFSLESAVINQYGNQIKKVAYETLENLGIDNVKLTIVDKGALDCTIKARIEAAVYRSVGQIEDLPWGGAIR